MAMSTAGLKAAILDELDDAGVSVLDDTAIEAIAKALVAYIQANATVTVNIGLTTSGLQTSTAAGLATSAPLVAKSLSGSIQ